MGRRRRDGRASLPSPPRRPGTPRGAGGAGVGLALVLAGLLSACGGLLTAEQKNPPAPTTPTTRTAPSGTARPPSTTPSATGRALAASGTPSPRCTGGQVVPIGVEGAAGSVTVTVRVTVAGRGPYLFALDTGA